MRLGKRFTEKEEKSLLKNKKIRRVCKNIQKMYIFADAK